MITTEMAKTVTLCRNNKKKPHIKPGRVLYGASIAGATLEQLHSSILSGRKERKMFDLREKVIQGMYEMIYNENLKSKMKKQFEKIMDEVENNLPAEKHDEIISMVCELEHTAFFSGANMVLDFISGKEVLSDEQ